VTENGNGTAANLSDDLIAKARAIASRSDELLKLLDDARQRLLDSGGGREPANGRTPAPIQAGSESEPSAGLRLLTSQMFASGAERREVADRLREDFAIEDPERTLKGMGL
jgi:hypothetical protein